MNSLATLDAKFMNGYANEIFNGVYHVKECPGNSVFMNDSHRYCTYIHERVLQGLQMVRLEEE